MMHHVQVAGRELVVMPARQCGAGMRGAARARSRALVAPEVKAARAREHARCTEANRRVRRTGRPGSYRASILSVVVRDGVETSYHATKGYRRLALGKA